MKKLILLALVALAFTGCSKSMDCELSWHPLYHASDIDNGVRSNDQIIADLIEYSTYHCTINY